MKNLFIFSIFLFLFNSGHSQEDSRFKDTRNIYLLDVTLSMFGKVTGNANIFDDVKKELIKAITAINNENTDIVVVTFQDEILNSWEAKATKEGKSKIISNLNSINSENVPKQYTNIYRVWNEGKSLVDNDKVNVIYLLTDGEHNVSHTPKEKLYKEVENWGSFALGNDYYAFLVELTEQAKDEELRKIIKKTNQAQIISGIEFFIVSIEDLNPVINTYDELIFNFNLLGDRLNSLPIDFTFELKLNDNNFELVDNNAKQISDLPLRIKLKPKKTIETIQKELDQKSFIELSLIYNEEKYPQIKVLNNKINCQVNNKKEMVLTIKVLDD